MWSFVPSVEYGTDVEAYTTGDKTYEAFEDLERVLVTWVVSLDILGAARYGGTLW